MTTTTPDIFKPNHTYTAKHAPTGETWVIIGVDRKRNKVCAAGWPPTMADFSDMQEWEERREIKEDELKYRNYNFGTNWE